MAAIIKIEAWRDIGFIEGGVEAPRLGAPAPANPDFVLQPDSPIVPSRERFFSEIKLKEYYSGMLDIGYLRVTYLMNNSPGTADKMIFYGWVDNVTLLSDGDIPTVSISWHIDEWRTYATMAAYGSGHVKRRPYTSIDETPIQNYPVRFYKQNDYSVQLLRDGVGLPDYVWWIIFAWNESDNDNTYIRYAEFPVRVDDISLKVYFARGEDPAYNNPSLLNVLNGYFDEAFDILPGSISGIWLSPIPTNDVGTVYSGDGSISNPYLFSRGSYYERGNNAAAIDIGNHASTDTITFDPIKSSEETLYYISSFDGSKILDLPYGMEISSCRRVLVVEADEAYIQLSFGVRKNGLDSVVGEVTNIPLTILPINTNAWSNYNFAGQRQYEKDMRNIATQANAWKNTTTQTAQGAMMGSFGPQGLVLGVVGGLVGGLSSYATEQLWQNDEEQRTSDRLMAKQESNLIMSSNSMLSVLDKLKVQIRSISPDSYSLSQLQSMRQQLGVSVDELRGNCESLVRNAVGYFNIQNLTVTGDIPVSAKQTIKRKFASGVRLR